VTNPWDVFAEIEFRIRTPGRPDGARRGHGWFAALSGQDHGELNICGLAPDATPASARALTDVLGGLPAVVFSSEHADDEARAVLVANGFAVATVPEPLMWCAERPAAADGRFRIEPASADHLGHAISLTAEAHRIDRRMLEATLGAAADAGAAEPWLAWDDNGPVSTVWLVEASGVIGVAEMMTPPRDQRRGAGRQLLSGALAARWTPETTGALLLSTAAGRRLYESIGFTAVDEVVTCFRGVDDDVLDAIGQPRA
jgi:hypothetical protein